MLEQATSPARPEKVLQRVNQIAAFVAGSIIMVMMVLTVIDVFLRYVFRKPLIWNFDLQTTLIVMVVFLGIAYVQNQRRHIIVDVLVAHLSRLNRVWLQLSNDILFLCFTFLVCWQSTVQAQEAFVLNDYLEGIVRIPIWPAKASIALGAGLLSLTLILHIYLDFRELARLRREETSKLGWNIKLGVSLIIWAAILGGTFWVRSIEVQPLTIGVSAIVIMFVLLVAGTPIAASTGLLTLWGIFILSGPHAAIGTAGSKPFQYVLSNMMSVIPLFILMGVFAGLAGFATSAYEAARRWLQGIPGGLIHATIAGMALFSAASGTSTAACATFSKLVLPELFRLKVEKSLALGAIACAATLDIMIPPSVTLVTYALLTQQSVGKLLIAGVVPGLLQAFMYMVLVFFRCKFNSNLIPKGPNFAWKERFTSLGGAWGLFFIVFVVMGGIYTGVFTPSEAAAIGTFAALMAVLFFNKNRFREIRDTVMDTVLLTSSIVLIIIGGMMFGNLLAQSRLPSILSEYIAGLSVPPVVILIAIMIFYLIIGCFMDALSILIITLPIFFPAVTALGYDPIWFGIMITITVEVALVSPPYGLNLFMMQAVVPNIKMGDLYRGVTWFIGVDVLSLILFIALPGIVMWLPNTMWS